MKKRVIIDCDPGIDDSLALMMALSSDAIDVIGITIVCGNSPIDMGFENAKKILHHMGRLDIPIYKGADRPLAKEYVNALDTHGEDGLGESFLEEIAGYDTHEQAVSFLARTLREGPCSVIALGPLTNFAQLIQEDEKAFDAIERLENPSAMPTPTQLHVDISPQQEKAIMWGLTVQPKHRPQSMDEFMDELYASAFPNTLQTWKIKVASILYSKITILLLGILAGVLLMFLFFELMPVK